MTPANEYLMCRKHMPHPITCFFKPKKCQLWFLILVLKPSFIVYYIFNIVPYMSALDSSNKANTPDAIFCCHIYAHQEPVWQHDLTKLRPRSRMAVVFIGDAWVLSLIKNKGLVHFQNKKNPDNLLTLMSTKMSMSFFLQSQRNECFLRKTLQVFPPYSGLQWQPMGWRSKLQLQRGLHNPS